MKRLFYLYFLLLTAYSFGAASGSPEEKSYYFLNNTGTTIKVRVRKGGDPTLEREIIALKLTLAQNRLDERAQALLAQKEAELASKNPIQVILPAEKDKIEDKEFFTLNPKTAFQFWYNATDGGPLRIRIWPGSAKPSPDVAPDGSPIETSTSNLQSTIIGINPSIISASTKGFILSKTPLIPTASKKMAAKNFIGDLYFTTSHFPLEAIIQMLQARDENQDRYTFFDTRPETYSRIPSFDARYGALQ